MGNIISILSGSESIPGASCSVNFQVMDENNVRISLAHRPTSTSTASSGKELYTHVAGEHTHHCYNLEDGTILKIVGNRSTPGRTGQMKRAMLRVDHRAPYNRLAIRTSGHERSTTSILYVEGRFWILKEAEAIRLSRSGKLTHTYRDIQNMFEIQELHPGAQMPEFHQKTVVVEGEERKIAVAKRKRALRL